MKMILKGSSSFTFVFCLACSLLLWAPPARAQGAANSAQAGTSAAVVSFEIEQKGVQPERYFIAVESTGRAVYTAYDAPEPGETESDPYIVKFTISERNRQRIFDLAREANYFKGDFDYTKSKIANTGIKTLGYTEGSSSNDLEHPDKERKNKATYNWSENRAIQQLTTIFQGIWSSMEFGRRLNFERRFDKLGLDAELKRMEEMQKSGDLEEVQGVAPALESIINDYSAMHVARERAKRILATAKAQQGPAQ